MGRGGPVGVAGPGPLRERVGEVEQELDLAREIAVRLRSLDQWPPTVVIGQQERGLECFLTLLLGGKPGEAGLRPHAHDGRQDVEAVGQHLAQPFRGTLEEVVLVDGGIDAEVVHDAHPRGELRRPCRPS